MKANTFAGELTLARKRRGLTQEQVCFSVGISDPATLSRWENGREIPSIGIADKLAEIYEDNILGYLYLQQCTPIGRRVLPNIVRRDIGNSVLLLQKEHTDLNKIKDVLIDIACDGVIQKEEEEDWNNSLKEIMELASACIGLTLSQNKKPLQDGGLERACV